MRARRNWSQEELDELRAAYAGGPGSIVDLLALSKRLDRDHHNVCRKARELGLTSYGRPKPPEAVAKMREQAATRWKRKPHPRGMAGKKHTAEALARIGQASRAQWADPKSPLNSPEATQRRSDAAIERIAKGGWHNGGYSRCRGGRRADLGGMFFRSSWEANYARYLQWLLKHKQIASWEYEPRTFFFEDIKLGIRSYTPDFRVVSLDGSYAWHEIKGWMDAKSKVKLSRMAKYYPNEPVIVIGRKWFSAATRQRMDLLIPNWERPKDRPRRRTQLVLHGVVK